MITRNPEFRGKIISTRATADACRYLLKDSATIQESDADYLNYKTVKDFLHNLQNSSIEPEMSVKELTKFIKELKSQPHALNRELINSLLDQYNLKKVKPLYTVREAEASFDYFQPTTARKPVQVGKNMSATFYNAGHILGSAMIVLHINEKGEKKTVMFTGDLGRYDKPIIRDPTSQFSREDTEIDLLIMESTYGDRIHEPVVDLKPMLKRVLLETYERGGVIMIPAFAYGRTQELIYYLHQLYLEDTVPKMDIYVDSPLAVSITKVFGEHPETYDEDTHKIFLENGLNPFVFPEIKYIQSVQESMRLNRTIEPHIVIAGSGMCEGGRILHHLRHRIEDERNTLLVVGYMAQNTLGRRILEKGLEFEQSGRKGQAPLIKFFGNTYRLEARVKMLGGFSAHADREEMTRFLKESGLKIKKIAVVHGEEEQSVSFRQHLVNQGYQAFVPRQGETIEM